MKDYFLNLFNYDRFANELITETIIKGNNPEKPVKLMAHLFAAQQIWLSRCADFPGAPGTTWPDWQADAFAGIMETNNARWLRFLEGLEPADFDRIISYKTLKGDSYQNKLVDILTHVINHGTHHRAQAGQHLIAAGFETLPPTDYIFFVR
ncbi:DinB family protein [Mucilaginibacter gotjawali]|uniref:Damage-inducible protein DinB n=2 Tax=Mucilaginibacter gotjawali TaxID=1550579 RepID=A0A839SCE9_9SPHI|nr:DinB family protein [Mucilaginibacter gotjawali]MBB3055861.1 putative damage-inducible protein DinB [Mucilaginibacter gotjawali]BAU54683.1 DinB family protein [Mucilaginibacter gotjawali]